MCCGLGGMLGFVGVGVGGGGCIRRRESVVCKKKGGEGGMEGKSKKAAKLKSAEGGGGKELMKLNRPVVSTEGLVEEVDLSAIKSWSQGERGGSLISKGGKFDDDEWIEWDKNVCGEWQQQKGTTEFINSLVPEILHLDFPSFAEAIKLVVVIVVLFFFLAGFTYTVDGLYLSLARKFFGSEYFF